MSLCGATWNDDSLRHLAFLHRISYTADGLRLINKVPHPLQHHSRQTRGRLSIFAMPPTIDVDEASAAPPDGGYGWVCVLSLFLVNFSTWGAVAVCETLYARRIMIALLTSDVSPSVYTSHTTCVPNAIPTHRNWSLLSLVVSTLRLR